jgi:hypothetical protein
MAKEKEEELPPLDINIEYPEEAEQAEQNFHPKIVQEILDNIRVGLSLPDCAYLVGLVPARVERWYRDNYCNFADSVNTNIALNKRLHIGRIQNAKHALKVKASSWFLERKYKEEFSKEVTVVVNHVLIDNVSRILKGLLIKYIKDPELLRLAAEEFQQKMSQVNLSDMPARITK